MNEVRQKRIESLLKEDISEMLRLWAKENTPGVLLSVSSVRVTPDLSIARINMSIFPSADKENILSLVKEHTSHFRGKLGEKVRHQLRKVPEIIFYIDEGYQRMEEIEKCLRGEVDNPIKDK